MAKVLPFQYIVDQQCFKNESSVKNRLEEPKAKGPIYGPGGNTP